VAHAAHTPLMASYMIQVSSAGRPAPIRESASSRFPGGARRSLSRVLQVPDGSIQEGRGAQPSGCLQGSRQIDFVVDLGNGQLAADGGYVDGVVEIVGLGEQPLAVWLAEVVLHVNLVLCDQ